ncbi:MAG: SDR family oxidoreductase [Deltaproteobacteria bacterium]|nr:SDR family oxidoreductase [Deltaproteobacteria bacterium]
MEHKRHRPLTGKVILITGASRGIGAAAAKRLARLGASLAINYNQRRDRALAVLDEIEKAGGEGMVFQADVTQKKQVDEMVGAVRDKFSAVDVLVNNAYFPFEVSPLHQISWDGLAEATRREISALYNCTQASVPGMIEKKKGKIVVISSRLAQQPLPRMGAYAAAKAALEAMANTMAIELGPLGITVNVVTPAFTLTDASSIMPDDFKERIRQSRPLRKHLYPEDVAGTIAFLASDAADMLTGSNVLVTGGSHFQI